MANQKFEGFDSPKQNWSRLPHQLIDAFPLISTKAELMCILYILRHTWGYHDNQKKLTMDEFQNGRKRKDGTRIDHGVGMGKQAIRKGLERAQEHGFIHIEEDNSDKARKVRRYSLLDRGMKITPQRDENHPSEGRKSPLDQRKKLQKETTERNSPPTGGNGNAPNADSADTPNTEKRQHQDTITIEGVVHRAKPLIEHDGFTKGVVDIVTDFAVVTVLLSSEQWEASAAGLSPGANVKVVAHTHDNHTYTAESITVTPPIDNNCTPSDSAVPIDVEAWLDAVGAATDTHAKRRWPYSHQLLGTAKTGEYAEWKLEEPVTLDELRAFTAWYKRAYPGLNMPQKPATLYNMVHEFRARRAENPDIGIGDNGADRPNIHDETTFPRFPDDDCPPELRGLGLIDVRQIPQDDSERYGRACDWNSRQHPQWAHWFEQWQEEDTA